jgi:hypothetical protein
VAISDPVALTSAPSTANSTTYDSTITGALSVDDTVFVTVYNVDASPAEQPTVAKIAGTATIGTVSLIGTVTQTDVDQYRITSFWCRVTGAGTLQVRATFSDGQTGCHIIVQPLRGTHLTVPIREVTGTPQFITNSGSASRPSTTLPAAPLAGSWTVHANSIRRSPAAWDTTEAGWIENVDSGLSTPLHGFVYEHKESGDQTYVADAGTNGIWRALSFEIAEAGGDTTATPSTVSAATTVPTPGVVGTSLATTTTVNATASVPTPVVTAVTFPTMTTVTATASVPTPTVTATDSGGVDVPIPASVDATTSIPTPSVTATSLATPSTVNATTTIPTPAVSLAPTAVPTTVDATVTVPTPSVVANALVVPTTVTATAAFFEPGQPIPDQDATPTPTTVDATVTIPTPAVVGTASKTLDTVNATVSIPTPTVSVSAAPEFRPSGVLERHKNAQVKYGLVLRHPRPRR